MRNRRIGFLLFLFALIGLNVSGQTNTVNVTYNWADFTTHSTSANLLTITPLIKGADYLGSTNLSNRVLRYPVSAYPSLTNGTLTVSNLITGYAYQVQISSGYDVTTITNYFPATLSGNVNGHDYRGVILYQTGGVVFQFAYFSTTFTNINLSVGSATNVFFQNGTNILAQTINGTNVFNIVGQIPTDNMPPYVVLITNALGQITPGNAVFIGGVKGSIVTASNAPATAVGGEAQSPWTNDVNAASFSLTNANQIVASLISAVNFNLGNLIVTNPPNLNGINITNLNATQISQSAAVPLANDWTVWNDASSNYYAAKALGQLYWTSNSFDGLMNRVMTNLVIGEHIELKASTYANPYIVSNTIFIRQNGVIIEGENNPASRIMATPALTGPVFQFGTSTNDTGGIARLQFLRFDSTLTTNADIVAVLDCPEPNFSFCEFAPGQSGIGIDINTTNETINWGFINNCWFPNITSNRFGVMIKNCPNNGRGNPSGLTIQNCISTGGTFVSVATNFYNLLIQNNLIRSGQAVGPGDRAIAITNGTGILIQGNQFVDYDNGAGMPDPVYIGSRSVATNDQMVISGNSSTATFSSESLSNVVDILPGNLGIVAVGNQSLYASNVVAGLAQTTNTLELDAGPSWFPNALSVGSSVSAAGNITSSGFIAAGQGFYVTNGSANYAEIGGYTGPAISGVSLFATNGSGILQDVADFTWKLGVTLNFGTSIGTSLTLPFGSPSIGQVWTAQTAGGIGAWSNAPVGGQATNAIANMLGNGTNTSFWATGSIPALSITGPSASTNSSVWSFNDTLGNRILTNIISAAHAFIDTNFDSVTTGYGKWLNFNTPTNGPTSGFVLVATGAGNDTQWTNPPASVSGVTSTFNSQFSSTSAGTNIVGPLTNIVFYPSGSSSAAAFSGPTYSTNAGIVSWQDANGNRFISNTISGAWTKIDTNMNVQTTGTLIVNPSNSPIGSSFVIGGTLAMFAANTNQYAEINVQNFFPGTNASSDITATANNGNSNSYYLNIGINSSSNQSGGLLGGTNTAYIIAAGLSNNAYGGASGSNVNLVIAALQTNTTVSISAGVGGNSAQAVVSSNGLSITGAFTVTAPNSTVNSFGGPTTFTNAVTNLGIFYYPSVSTNTLAGFGGTSNLDAVIVGNGLAISTAAPRRLDIPSGTTNNASALTTGTLSIGVLPGAVITNNETAVFASATNIVTTNGDWHPYATTLVTSLGPSTSVSNFIYLDCSQPVTFANWGYTNIFIAALTNTQVGLTPYSPVIYLHITNACLLSYSNSFSSMGNQTSNNIPMGTSNGWYAITFQPKGTNSAANSIPLVVVYPNN